MITSAQKDATIPDEEAFVAKLAELANVRHAPRQSEVRTERAYAIGDPDESRDSKRIVIPEGWSYYNHELHRWTASPNIGESEAETDKKWYVHSGVTRGAPPEYKILDVWVEVWASGKPLFGARRWIGIDLSVTIVKNSD